MELSASIEKLGQFITYAHYNQKWTNSCGQNSEFEKFAKSSKLQKKSESLNFSWSMSNCPLLILVRVYSWGCFNEFAELLHLIYNPSLNQKWIWTRKIWSTQNFWLWKMDNGPEKMKPPNFFATFVSGQWTYKNEAFNFFCNFWKWTMDIQKWSLQIFCNF